MKQRYTSFPLLLFIVGIMASFSHAQPLINRITAFSEPVEQNSKFEVEMSITGTYDNPYDYDQIETWAIFKGPNSEEIKVDGFYTEDFILNDNGSLTPDGNSFKVRFAPPEPGTWEYQVFVKDPTGTASLPPFSLTVTPRASLENHGYLRTNGSNYLSFDDGEQFILIGENMSWQNNNPFVDYKKWIDRLTAEGGNFFRLWHAHWGLGIEWTNGWNNFQGLRKYKDINGRYQDWLFDYCAENGVYVMLALQHHGPVSSQVNPNWNESPYNAANGGPCQNTWDFFTNSEAIAHTKNRYRYIVARWGYARSVLAWELFNEVEWTDNYDQHREDIMAWHAEMATYLKSIDPYGHLVTTSFAKAENDPLVWVNPDMDITQTHHYLNTPNLERALVSSTRTYLTEYEKPTLNGEFGLGPASSLRNIDPDGIHIHNGLWAAIFGGGMGTGMTWWWDIYIDPQDLYYHFGAIAKIVPEIPFVEKKMAPGVATVTGAEGDLVLTPSQDWGVIGIDSVFINQDGTIAPADPGANLSTFLYGSQWNTQFRSPPVFRVYYPAEGTFTVRTGGGSGTAPRLNIRLNGNQVLSQNAQPNDEYTISVPPGLHNIRVDNTGTDWINISGYEFSGLGSALDAYVLVSEDQRVVAGYVLHNEYNHEEVVANGPPAPIQNAYVQIPHSRDSMYFVKWYDCISGNIVAVEPTYLTEGFLSLQVPDLIWDLAFIVDDKDAVATANEEAFALNFNAYPNPVIAGGEVEIDLGTSVSETVKISLLDMSGRRVYQQEEKGQSSFQLPIRNTLSKGIYWVKVETDGRQGSRPIVVR